MTSLCPQQERDRGLKQTCEAKIKHQGLQVLMTQVVQFESLGKSPRLWASRVSLPSALHTQSSPQLQIPVTGPEKNNTAATPLATLLSPLNSLPVLTTCLFFKKMFWGT